MLLVDRCFEWRTSRVSHVIYINDLPYKIVNVTKLFADYSKVISSIKVEMDMNKLRMTYSLSENGV